MRRELTKVTTAILDDARGAELETEPPRSALYRTELGDSAIARGTFTKTLSRTAALEVRTAVLEAAEAIGIERPAMERRLEHPAANAWQKREWVKADLQAVSRARGFDLDHADQRHQAAEVLNHALGVEHARETVHSRESDCLVRALETLGRVHRQHSRVEFEQEDHAERFARDLKERYGEKVMDQIAAGDDRALVAESHESLGLSGGRRNWPGNGCSRAGTSTRDRSTRCAARTSISTSEGTEAMTRMSIAIPKGLVVGAGHADGCSTDVVTYNKTETLGINTRIELAGPRQPRSGSRSTWSLGGGVDPRRKGLAAMTCDLQEAPPL